MAGQRKDGSPTLNRGGRPAVNPEERADKTLKITSLDYEELDALKGKGGFDNAATFARWIIRKYIRENQ